MKKIVAALIVLFALSIPATAMAHPLGNFTVNRYAELVVSGKDTYVRYALDLAEIPTLQEGDRVTAAGLGRKLELTVDGKRADLVLVRAAEHRRPGAGGLDILRVDAVFRAPSGNRIELRDRNYENRIGWREVVVRAERGAQVSSSTAPTTSASDALRAYPKDRLRSPLAVSSATAVVIPGTSGGAVPSLVPVAPEETKHGFESLIARGDLGAGVIVLALLIAAFWGAAHALTPGHGKAIVAGYLVGTRGTPWHAVALGLIVTVTHTIGVFSLGLVTLALSAFLLPEQLYPWLTLFSGLLVVAVGASVLWSRGRHAHAHHHGHDHHHDHDHGHEHGISRRNLLGIGISAGIIPCPSALVVLLSAIALHRIGFGLALIVAFSVGLAATVTGIGLVAVAAQRTFGRMRLDNGVVRALPAVSAGIIVVVGLVLTLRALPGVV